MCSCSRTSLGSFFFLLLIAFLLFSSSSSSSLPFSPHPPYAPLPPPPPPRFPPPLPTSPKCGITCLLHTGTITMLYSQLTIILLANSFSPNFFRAAWSTDHDGTPF